MTSANTVEYNIYNSNQEQVGRHSQNVMCMRCNDGLEKFTPAKDFTIQPWGYDEEEEMWEDEPVNLEDWLTKNKAEFTHKVFKVNEVVNLKKKRGLGTILEVIKKTFTYTYLVELENKETIEIYQSEIRP